MTDSAVLAERAALEQEVAGRTLCDELAAAADSFGERPAYSDRDGAGPWQTLTWSQTRQRALELAAGFRARPAARRRGGADDAQPGRARPGRPRRRARGRRTCDPLRHPRARPGEPSSRRTARRGSPCSTARISWPDGSPSWPSCPGAQDHRSRRGGVPVRGRFITWADFQRSARRSGPRTRRRWTSAWPRSPRRPGGAALHLGNHRQPQGRGRSPTPRRVRVAATVRAGTFSRSPVGLLSAARAHRRADVQLYPPVGSPPTSTSAPTRQPADRHGRRGPADRVLRRAPGLGEDPGRDPGPDGGRAGRGEEGRGGRGHGGRPARTSGLPVRLDRGRGAGRAVRAADAAVLGRSGRCSASARRRSCSARPRRCRPRSAGSSPGSA